MKKDRLLLLAVVFLLNVVSGQVKFPNTLFLNDSIGSPAADLSDIAWIEGHWKGEAFGGIIEEVWTPALGKSMMCAFKLVVDGEVSFYELLTIVEENGSLILRLKHFHANLFGWEEKDETVDFKLVKLTEIKVYFDGFTFERVSDHEIIEYVVLQSGDDQNEVPFRYQKVID